jgi:hypothetical protein
MTDDAYAQAGFSPNRGNAARLKANEDILARVLELQERAERRLFLTKQYVIDALIENAEKALGRRPVQLGKPDGEGQVQEVYVYEGAVANAAIRMAGLEMAMFTDRRDVKINNENAHLTDEQLAQKLVEVGQQMLKAGTVIEHDGTCLIGGPSSVPPKFRPRSR